MKKTHRRWSGLPWQGDIIYAITGSIIFLLIAVIIRSVVGLPSSTPTEDGIKGWSWTAFTICEIIFILWAHSVDDQEYTGMNPSERTHIEVNFSEMSYTMDKTRRSTDAKTQP